MSRRKKDPLRPLTDAESAALTQLSRSQAAPAAQVARAAMLLAVARGDDYQQAARAAGRRSGDAVSHLVARFNAEGLAALDAPPRRRTFARSTTRRRGSGSSARSSGPRPRRPTARRPGRLSTLREALRVGARRPAAGLDLHPLAGAPRGRLQPSEHPHLVPHRHRPAPPQGRARRSSPTRTPSRKKVDRGRLPPRRGDGPAGLVHRPGRAVPDDPLPRAVAGGPRASRRASRTSTSATARPRS